MSELPLALRAGLAWTLAASLLCFAAYAWDKAAAARGRWRTSERTLLLAGLLGGWPGALLAQRLLRHKTRKTGFQRAFWTTVVANVTLWAGLAVWLIAGKS